MRPSGRRPLPTAHARPQSADFRERNPALAEQGQRRESRPMSNTLRERVLLQALEIIPATGFSETTLSTAAERAAVSKREMQDAFPQGPASLAEAFSVWADDRMAERMTSADVPERMRDRVAAAVRARIEVLAPYKEAARRAAAFLAQPQNAALAAKLLMATVDAIWRAAGDRSSDFSYYTKRGMLAGVYGA